MISEATAYRQQLMLKLRKAEGEIRINTNLLGKIYRAWTDLKVVLAANTQRSVITSCLYNEGIALHAYRAALSTHGLETELAQMLTAHEAGLNKNCDLLKSCRDVRQTFSRPMYT
jgi:hypothetical protein